MPDSAAVASPLLHQIVVSERWRQRGVATLLMNEAEQLVIEQGIATLGITVGLFDTYGPAQRTYTQRGCIPDGRGACQGHQHHSEGTRVRLDHDVMLWLTKDLASRPLRARQ